MAITDEQPTAHFYGYHISFDATGVEPVDHVLKAIADAGRGSHRTHNWAELGLEEEIQLAAGRAAEAFRARDAEVQALREELLNYVSADEMAGGEGYGTYPNSEHRRIRALVAGEEGNNHE